MPVETKPLPSQEYLRECFDYDPETGLLRWRERPLHHFKSARAAAVSRRFAGREAGRVGTLGYRYVVLGRSRFTAARLIFAWLGFQVGSLVVDHINGDRMDNRRCNLRLVTQRENCRNLVVHRAGRPLPVGVRVDRIGRFKGGVRVGKRDFHLGTFDTPEAASAAYEAAVAAIERGSFVPVVAVRRCGRRGRVLPTGVYLAPSGRFLARAWLGGRKVQLGTFDTPEAASAAYQAAVLAIDAGRAVRPVVGRRGVRGGRALPTGVYRSRAARFFSRALVGGVRVHLGTFDTPEAASAAYQAAVAAADRGARA